MRQIVLDTETTGLDPKNGHRIIEIGAVELIERRITGQTLHFYINPERQVEAEALKVHGISNEFLRNKPTFSELVADIMDFLEGGELIIHNAPFDLGFLDHELKLCRHKKLPGSMLHYCQVLDTLEMARQKYPGQRNSLDALCKRYSIDNSSRLLHGALLDAQILAQLYLAMTGGQESLSLGDDQTDADNQSAVTADNWQAIARDDLQLLVQQASADELAAHQAYLEHLQHKSGEQPLWQKLGF